jgi:hypothetical protein
LRDDDKSSARQVCNGLLQDQEIHPFYQMKSHIMLAALADIPPVAEDHFIKSGLRDLGPEMRQWKMEEGLYISSSDEDSETEDAKTSS